MLFITFFPLINQEFWWAAPGIQISESQRAVQVPRHVQPDEDCLAQGRRAAFCSAGINGSTSWDVTNQGNLMDFQVRYGWICLDVVRWCNGHNRIATCVFQSHHGLRKSYMFRHPLNLNYQANPSDICEPIMSGQTAGPVWSHLPIVHLDFHWPTSRERIWQNVSAALVSKSQESRVSKIKSARNHIEPQLSQPGRLMATALMTRLHWTQVLWLWLDVVDHQRVRGL